MQQFVSEGSSDSSDVTQPITEQVDAPLVNHTAADYPVIGRFNASIRENVPFAVADKNGGLMAKLSQAFFNYLRNRCL